MSKNIYPAISPYPGAKAGYVGQVIAEILPYEGIKQYFEVFGGMANIILHKSPHPEEYYNDLNKKLTTLMYVLSDETMSQQLFQLMLNPEEYYNQSGFDYAKFASNHMLSPDSEFMKEYAYNHELSTVEKAAQVWRTLLMSFNGSMQNFKGPREVTKDGIHFEVKDDHIKGTEALNLEHQLLKKINIPQRMQNVTILNVDAFKLIDEMKPYDDVLMVCDSPYTKKQMGSKVIYECEFSEADQYRYMNLIYDSHAKILVCGYSNEIYDGVLLNPSGLHKWYKYEIAEVAKTMSLKALDEMKSRATEVIWTNWKIM